MILNIDHKRQLYEYEIYLAILYLAFTNNPVIHTTQRNTSIYLVISLQKIPGGWIKVPNLLKDYFGYMWPNAFQNDCIYLPTIHRDTITGTKLLSC